MVPEAGAGAGAAPCHTTGDSEGPPELGSVSGAEPNRPTRTPKHRVSAAGRAVGIKIREAFGDDLNS